MPGVADVIRRATDTDVAQRYPSAAALEVALVRAGWVDRRRFFGLVTGIAGISALGTL